MSAGKPSILDAAGCPGAAEQIKRYVLDTLPPFSPPDDVETWSERAAAMRREALEHVFLRGWPRDLIERMPPVVWGDVLRPDAPYVIRKLRFEVVKDYWIPALLYEPLDMDGQVPVVLNANGHHTGGKAASYKQARCANLARRGMLALSVEFIGMGELGGDFDHNWIALFDLAGAAGVGIFYLAMSKALDVLLAHEHADPARVAMTGLSGGGWQTIVLSALDERITASIPVAGYTCLRRRAEEPSDVGDIEQAPPDMGTVLDYAAMTGMLAPRPALLILNDQDECCFRTDRTKPFIYDAVRPVYTTYGADERFVFYNNTDPGTHNYDADNRSQLYRFLSRHFSLDCPLTDVHADEEILPESALNVGLPDEQVSLVMLARRLARPVARMLKPPKTADECEALRERLRDILRLPPQHAAAKRKGEHDGHTVFSLTMGPWTFPVVIADASSRHPVTLGIADDERLAGQARTAASPVVTAHVLDTGALQGNAAYRMLLEACGQRVLGIQVGQVLAAARFAIEQTAGRRVDLVARGLNSSVACLLAAALEPGLFERLTTHDEPGSLLELYDRRLDFDDVHPVLCPNLLTTADIPQLIALLDGVPYSRPDRRVKDILTRNE